jgi:hypothetical protein
MDVFKIDGSCSCHLGNPPCGYCLDGKWECGECGERFSLEEDAEDCCQPPEPRED